MGRAKFLSLMGPWVTAVVSGCGACPAHLGGESTIAAPAAPAAPAPAVSTSSPATPRLVILAVFDQLGADTLARHLPHLDPEGAIRTGIDDGAFYPHARYPQAVTLTGPGHAVLGTGAAPADSGITANEMRMPDGRMTASVQDASYPTLAHSGEGVAPTLLAAPTLADALREQLGDASRIVSISIKDRGAVLPAGKKPDVVLWYEAALGRFTSSTYYGPQLPAWVTQFEQDAPIQDLLVPWTVPDADALKSRLGDDEAPGEGDFAGFGTVFPHDPTATAAPMQALRMMPALSERLVSLAQRAVEAEQLGARQAPDFLSLSISGTDYAGHVFGPDSWEYFDHLRRADRALGQLIRTLRAQRPVTVLITSDHGVARLPERDQALRRVPSSGLTVALEQALDKEFGAQTWVGGFGTPYLYLSSEALSHPRLAEARAHICAVLKRQPGIAHVVDLAAKSDAAGACALSHLPAELQEPVRLSLYPGRSGDFYVIPSPGLFVEEVAGPGVGTTHGSPWTYDRTVPIVVYGKGVANVRHDEQVDMRQVVPSLAKLLGVSPPVAARAEPLPGVMRAGPRVK